MRVCTISDRHNGTQAVLESQLEVEGIPYLHYSLRNFTWKAKIEAELEVAKMLSSEFLIFVDPWDVQLNSTAQKLQELQSAMIFDKLVFPADCGCWPDKEKASLYPASPTPWRYICGGAPSGLGKDIAACIEYGIAKYGLPGEVSYMYDPLGTDQRFYTNVFLDYVYDGKGALDSDTKLQMSLSGAKIGKDYKVVEGRVINSVNSVTPIFVHANGYSTFPKGTQMVAKSADQLVYALGRP